MKMYIVRLMNRELCRCVRAIVLVCTMVIGVTFVSIAQAQTNGSQYEFDIEETTLGAAMDAIVQQTNVGVLYPYELASTPGMNPVTGRYALAEAIEILFRETQFSGGLTESGMIVIARKKDAGASYREDEIVVGKQIKNTLLAGASALVIGGVATPAIAQTDTPVATNAGAVVAVSDGSVTGHVTERRTGTDLSGVLVRIVETGATTQTDRRGNFRFPSVVPGNYTLQISYIGFPEHRAEFALGEVGQDLGEFPLGSADKRGSDEIIVFGSRSSRQIALNLQRVASNSSDVISADELGNFTGTTISDALRRVAAVSFVRDDTNGDGTNIIIRGLEPSMNAVKLNGLILPVGNGQDRSANLSNLLVDSVDRITIHKTLLPSHDSAGTGGLVEIETKTPLSRDRRYANFALEGGKKGGDFGKDMLASGTVSGTFGKSENFGLSASLQYRKRSDKTLGYGADLRFGKYLPLFDDGTTRISSIDHVDPRLDFPYADDDTVYTSYATNYATQSSTETLGLTLSAEWQMTDTTNLTLDYVRTEGTRDRFSQRGSGGFQSRYDLRPVAALGGDMRYALTFPGDVRVNQGYDFTDGAKNLTDALSFRGRTETGKWDVNYTLGYAHGSSDGGRRGQLSPVFDNDYTVFDNSLFLPSAIDADEGLVISAFGPRTGNNFPVPLVTDAAWDIFNNTGNYFFARADTIESKGQNDRYTAQLSSRYSFDQTNLKYLEFGLRYEESKNTSQTSGINYGAATTFDPNTFETIYPTLDEFGLQFESELGLGRIGGNSRGFSYLSESSVRSFFGGLDALAEGGTASINKSVNLQHPRANDAFTKENNWAGWAQGQFDIGKLEIIGGVRVNRVETESLSLSRPQIFPDYNAVPDFQALLDEVDAFQIEYTSVVEGAETQTDVLPRVLFNYRHNDNTILRGGYFLTVGRPSISQLNSEQTIFADLNLANGPNGDQALLRVSEGNPGLKAAITHNFDLSIEQYNDTIGFMKLSGFYKNIKNSFQGNERRTNGDVSGVVLPDHFFFTGSDASGPLGEFTGLSEYLADGRVETIFSQPTNSDQPTHIWGIEAQFERQFTFLPGIWDGFGIYTNIAYTDSSVDKAETWYAAPLYDANGDLIPGTTFDFDFGCFCFTEVPDPENFLRGAEEYVIEGAKFNSSPEITGTVALTYSKYNIDAALSYGFQSRYQTEIKANNLAPYVEGVGTLDFRGSYYFDRGDNKFRVFIEGTDLLKGTDVADLENTIGGDGFEKYYTSATYLGGRKIRVGASVTF